MAMVKRELDRGSDGSSYERSLSRLTIMCLRVASESMQNVQAWRRQKRTMEHFPAHLAQSLFHRLLRAGLLNAPLLELFQDSIEEVDVCSEACVDSEWFAYFGDFHFLRVLEAADCRSITNFALLQLKGLDTLVQLNLSRCTRVTDEGLEYIKSLTNLQKLGISETGVTEKGLCNLLSFKSLQYLDLGGLPVTDSIFSSLLPLNHLKHLVLWGSNVSDKGVLTLDMFPHLEHLNLAWTNVSKVPPLLALKHLNMANCKLSSLFEGWDAAEASLVELHLPGVDFVESFKVLDGRWIHNVSVMDISSSNWKHFGVLSEMQKLEILNLSGTMPSELVIQTIANIGSNLKQLDLTRSKVDSACVAMLAGHVPKLEEIVLSGTMVDDTVFNFLQLMPALKTIDLSCTAIKGFDSKQGEGGLKSSSFEAIQHLASLRVLNLQHTFVSKKGCRGLLCLSELTHLFLRSELLPDSSLQLLSHLQKLIVLGIEGAMITDSGLQSFKPPSQLKELVLYDCWLLTVKALLQFSELYRGLQIRHGLLSGGSGSVRASPVKDSRLRCSPDSQMNRSRKGDKKWAVKPWEQREKVTYLFTDERIRYTKDDLLALRCTKSYNEQLLEVDLGKIPTDLLSVHNCTL